MSYTVTFTPDARDALAEMWMNAADKEDLARAADEMERQLASDPFAVGESRVVDIRIVIVPPLAAYYDARKADRLVKVWRIWRWDR
jgi:hypothetical protein